MNRVFTNSHYEKIRKVVSIWIQMSVDEDVANTITEYGIEEKNVVGNARGDKRDYDLLSVILLRLGNPDQAKGEPILRLLDVLLSAEKQPDEKEDNLEKDFDILSAKAKRRAEQYHKIKHSAVYKIIGRIRNGVETTPSRIRNKYLCDKMPVRGKLRTKQFFGFKVMAANAAKLIRHVNGLPGCIALQGSC